MSNWFLVNTRLIEYFVPVLAKKVFGDYILKVCKIGIFPMKAELLN